jgi:hypothetical protein
LQLARFGLACFFLHGVGGRALGRLIEEILLAAFESDHLRAGDQAAFAAPAGNCRGFVERRGG